MIVAKTLGFHERGVMGPITLLDLSSARPPQNIKSLRKSLLNPQNIAQSKQFHFVQSVPNLIPSVHSWLHNLLRTVSSSLSSCGS